MGKKGKDKKKGKGADKTAAKTDKKLTSKQKKQLEALGEANVEEIIAEIEAEDKKRNAVTETVVEAPSRRSNFSFIAHPDAHEIVLFGGELFDGQKTLMYNELFFYNISANNWTILKAPGAPPPRCGHQMVATSVNKGQLWLFGGEYASPTLSQYYHYRDLWIYHIHTKRWEKITAPNGPSARSGHRMVLTRKQIILFGGFHDNLRDYKYFNDLFSFNTDTYTWHRIEAGGTAPAPRSGCCMAALPDGRVLMYGGYSKQRIKKDVDRGQCHTDAYLLTPEKNDETGLKWKWVSTKLGNSSVMSARCSMPITVTSNQAFAYCYGGVHDVDEDEENIAGTFFDDLFTIDLQKLVWHRVNLSGPRQADGSRRKKDKDSGDNDAPDIEMEVDSIQLEQQQSTVVVADDGVFRVTVGPAPVSASQSADASDPSQGLKLFSPSARMNSGMAIKQNVLYLYGGLVEDGDKELTLRDFYALDLKKLEEWRTIISDDVTSVAWLGSDSESGDSPEADDESESDDSDDSE